MSPNSKFFGHSTEIILQSKIKGPLKKGLKSAYVINDWSQSSYDESSEEKSSHIADEITAAKTDNNEPTSSSDDFQVE